jgi:hypothetical protein
LPWRILAHAKRISETFNIVSLPLAPALVMPK